MALKQINPPAPRHGGWLDFATACGDRSTRTRREHSQVSLFEDPFTGRGLRLWALAQLRCMLIADQWCYAYYQRFQSAKDIFWAHYEEQAFASNPIFRAQLGRVDLEAREPLHPERDGDEHEPSEPGADQLVQAGDRQGEPGLRHRFVLFQGREQPAESHGEAV